VTVPDYQTLMAPALRALADGTEQPISQLRGVIAKQVELTDEDLKATLPSGSPLFANRLHWTITYLHQAGLVHRPRRAVVQITSRGLAVLAEHPDRVNVGVLLQFEEFLEFRSRTRGEKRLQPILIRAIWQHRARPRRGKPLPRRSRRLTTLWRPRYLTGYGT
jgi:restriction system protein